MPELSRFYGIVVQMYCGDQMSKSLFKLARDLRPTAFEKLSR